MLRFLLAVAVIIGHTSPLHGFQLVGGKTAVETFFIISGFYMALVINEKYNKTKHNYRLFIGNRFLRIFPMYWTMLIIVLIWSYYYQLQNVYSHFTPYITWLPHMSIGSILYFIFINLFLFGQDTVYFLGLDPSSGNLFFTTNYANTSEWLEAFLFIPQAWTLSIELIFYLFAPFIIKRGWQFVLLICVLSFVIKISTFSIGLTNDPWPYRFLPAEFGFFMLGSFSYYIYRLIKNKDIHRIYLWLTYIVVILFTVFFSLIPGANILDYDIYRGVYYLLIVGAIPFLFYLTRLRLHDNLIGRLSYPMYISHIFIIALVNQYFPGAYTRPTFYPVSSIVLTVILSILLLIFIDTPFEKIKSLRMLSFSKADNKEAFVNKKIHT